MLRRSYPSVPAALICDPGEMVSVETVQTQFFTDVLEALGYTDVRKRSSFCQIRLRVIHREKSDANSSSAETNDYLTELRVAGVTVATVLAVRTDFNYVQVMFGLHVTPELEERICFKAGAL